jgi:hypothetical protein
MTIKSLTILTSALLLIAPNLKAESEPFFEQDFAREPGSDDTKQNKKPTSSLPVATTPPKPEVTLSLADQVKEIRGDVLNRRSRKLGSATPIPPSGNQTMQVLEVGGIVNSSDPVQFLALIEDFVATLKPKSRTANVIYAVGNKTQLPIKLEHELAKLGGYVRFVKKLPTKYTSVKSTPTWILASDNQEILIEASGKLSENLSVEGAIITQARDKVSS